MPDVEISERTFVFMAGLARRMGCPERHVEDCAQEMMLAVWRAGDRRLFIAAARAEAIDFLRREVRSRLGHDREGLPLSAMPGFDVAAPARESLIDARIALNALTIREMALLRRSLAGERLSALEQKRLSLGRQALRMALVGAYTPPDRPYPLRIRCRACRALAPALMRHKRYCSPRCAARGPMWLRRPAPARWCDYCGARLQLAAWWSRRRFCGAACDAQWHRGRRPSDYDRLCAECGGPFRAKNLRGRFCGRPCKQRARRRRERGAVVASA